MRRIFVLTALFLIAASVQVHATIKGVPGQYSTIQAAINSSSNGDTILVEPGTYTENINFRGKNIVLTSRYYLAGDPSFISSTIINGGSPVYYDTMSCVIIAGHEDSTTVLQGFTVTGGRGTKWQDEHGAGRYREGAGILIQFSSPVIQYNIIKNNQSISTDTTAQIMGSGGGGMRIGDSRPKIYNNIIMGNYGKYGAGVVMNYTGMTFKNNIVCLNYGSGSYGGGASIWINSSLSGTTKTIENNTIVFNTGVSNGTGGIFIQSTTAALRNNIIWGNDGATNHTQISGIGTTTTYCDVQDGFTGAGNINADPMFADSSYFLQSLSPCVDKGDSSIVYNDPPDPNNTSMALYPSRGTIRNDMGAYGGPLRRVLTNQLIGIHQISGNVPKDFSLKQNYPNPFNPATNIKYQITKNSFVTLAVFNVLGKEILKLVNENQLPGTYEVNWNAENIPSGVYFYRLIAGDFSVVKKMILVK